MPRTRRKSDNPAAVGLAQAIAAYAYGLRVQDFGGPRGAPKVAEARQVAMYLARVALRLGTRQIARAFGRDHATVLHACRRVEEAREDPAFDRSLEWLEIQLRRAAEATP